MEERPTTCYLICMTLNLRSITITLVIVLMAFAATGCMVEQNLTITPDLSGVWTLEGESMPFTATAFDDLAMLGGYDDATALYDEAVINSRTDLEKRDDIGSYMVERVGQSGWEAEISFDSIESLLGDAKAGGIAEITRSGNTNTLTLKFDRNRAASLEELMPVLKEPSFSLFNPAATGGIDEETYITGILGFTFGEENIPDIRRAAIRMNVTVPGEITTVSGGQKTSPNSVLFETSLTRFLVPDDEIFWSLSWSGNP